MSIVTGITIGLIASFVQSLGLTIQRKSHVLNELLPEHKQRVEHRRPLWLLGFAIFISSNLLGSLVQIASLPVVILAPLGAVSLLWNAFFARLLLGDVFSPWMVLGTVLIAGGAVLIGIFGIVPEPTRSLEDLIRLFTRPTFVLYFSLLGFLVVVCLAITHIAEYSLHRPVQVRQTTSLHPTDERTPLLDRKSPSARSLSPILAVSNPRTRISLSISYASVSGILSGMCLLFAKSGVELLLLTVRGDNQFWRWQAWLLVLGLVAFALLQLWYLHKALVLADPTLVCPSAFCFYNLSSILNGLVYFDQFSLIAPLHLVLVMIGIVILLSGVWVVSIHSGGGGVEMGSTFDEIPVPVVPDIAEEEEVAAIGEDEIPPDWGTRSEPSLGTSTVMSPENVLGFEEGPISPISTVTCPPLPSPVSKIPTAGPSRLGRHERHSTYDSISYSRRTLNPLSPPINAVASLAGAGIQIGLSPLSPGFSVLPRRRVSQSGLGRPGGELQRRRTVSEGYLQSSAPIVEDRTGSGNVPAVAQGRVPKRKWRWLKKFGPG